MAEKRRRLKEAAAAVALGAALGAAPVQGADTARVAEAIRAELEALKSRIRELEKQLAEQRRVEQEVKDLRREVRSAAEWKSPNTLIHMAGYADVGYTDTRSRTGTFGSGTFNPILHYQYRDVVMLESELAMSVDELGETTTELEYLTIDWFANDYVTVVAGKFLSPLGWFRQNLHPSWINKLPSAPAGFGHDQAAPNAEVGVQVRGGVPVSGNGNRLIYAFYVGNGPAAEIESGEIEMIETPGLGGDADGKKVFGGRLGLYFPGRRLELGLSGAAGRVGEIEEVGKSRKYTGVTRDYDFLGADFTWRPRQFEVRGEWVRQKVGDQPASSAPEGGTWQAWYLQGSYRFMPHKWEVVARLGRYRTPHSEVEQKALGLNYIFASNFVAKLAYEFNDDRGAESSGYEDRLLLQASYGF